MAPATVGLVAAAGLVIAVATVTVAMAMPPTVTMTIGRSMVTGDHIGIGGNPPL